jgi:beta-lactamase class D/beta-lactamase class D OXA-1
LNQNKLIYSNHSSLCNKRLSADSTFKVALSLMAYNEKLITSKSIIPWDGKKKEFEAWAHNQTPKSWLKYSVVWVSQRLTPKLGMKKIKYYLNAFHYGNQNFEGNPKTHDGLTQAWLSSSLKISASEQLAFLNNMINHSLPLSPFAVDETIKNMALDDIVFNGYHFYGKTGSGHEPQKPHVQNGWFIGFMTKGKKRYSFVSNMRDAKAHLSKRPYGGALAKAGALSFLNNLS